MCTLAAYMIMSSIYLMNYISKIVLSFGIPFGHLSEHVFVTRCCLIKSNETSSHPVLYN